ncbi:MAG: hypothetical protein ACK53C_17195 [Pseudomonadota bacterium]
MNDARYAYASARLDARRSVRPTAARRALLESSREPEHYLETLRAIAGGRQAAWLEVPATLGARDVDAHEAWLRAEWREGCAELASWYPPEWAAAFAWCAVLPDLEVLERLRAAPAGPSWAAEDPVLAPVARAEFEARADALRGTAHAPLAAAWRAGTPLRDAWIARWLEVRPPVSRRVGRLLHLLGAEVLAAARLPGRASRESLERSAARLYRAGRGTPAAAFALLVLRALDATEWRGGLAARTVMPERGGP